MPIIQEEKTGRNQTMIRNDFVSNSSSSSYIISIGKNYPIKSFINDLCKNCDNKKKKYHITDLRDKNKAVLTFHMYNIRLLFLGEVYICDKELLIDFNNCPKWHDKTSWEYYFNNLKKDIEKKGKDGKFTRWNEDFELLNDTQIRSVYHYYISGLCLNRFDRQSDFEVMHSANKKFEKQYNDGLVKRIKDFLKLNYKKESSVFHNNSKSSIYIIDEKTIELTEFMIERGFKINLYRWEKHLSSLKKRIKDGETILSIEIAHSGNGMDVDTIYNETENDAFKNVPVEFLASESL